MVFSQIWSLLCSIPRRGVFVSPFLRILAQKGHIWSTKMISGPDFLKNDDILSNFIKLDEIGSNSLKALQLEKQHLWVPWNGYHVFLVVDRYAQRRPPLGLTRIPQTDASSHLETPKLLELHDKPLKAS